MGTRMAAYAPTQWLALSQLNRLKTEPFHLAHDTERVDTRSGYYERGLQTKAGEVPLKVPRLRRLPLETQIIERYRRRESSVEEAMIEMYMAGVSLRRVEDITEMLWRAGVSPSTGLVSRRLGCSAMVPKVRNSLHIRQQRLKPAGQWREI